MTRIRGIDIVWLFFLGALAALGWTKPEHSPYEWLALLVLGAIQIAESHLGATDDDTQAALAIGVKLSLCYLLVWETGGIESSYYLIFLLPIVSGASRFGIWGAMATCVLSAGLYLSFLLYVLDTSYVPPEGARELAVRIIFFFLSAVLVNRLATENRLKTERLAEANRELSAAQAEVRRSERLAALGQLSAGLAHELRNPLGVISASAELLNRHVEKENEVAREVAGMIRGEVERTNALVTRFLDFARPSKLHVDLHDLNEVIEAALAQLREKLREPGSGFQIERDLKPVPPFLFDRTLIESSLANLFLNGLEAMSGGGVLRVSSGMNGAAAMVEVSDSGNGIPREDLEAIFNPFYTTKARGVGLGLAMVSKFIDSHGGSITVSSEPGRGSTFRIFLPMETRP